METESAEAEASTARLERAAALEGVGSAEGPGELDVVLAEPEAESGGTMMARTSDTATGACGTVSIYARRCIERPMQLLPPLVDSADFAAKFKAQVRLCALYSSAQLG